jgi:uncharacterized protein YjiS (DUF1127 family)
MTTYDQSAGSGSAGAGFAAATTGAFGRCAATVRRRREIARCERHLRDLPDAMLKDIGLHRSEIPGIVRFGRIEYGG